MTLFLRKLSYIQFTFPKELTSEDGNKLAIRNEPLKIIEKYLQAKSIRYEYSSNHMIHTHGIVITQLAGVKNRHFAILIKIAPYSFSYNEELINSLCDILYGEKKINKFWAHIVFNNDVDLETTNFKASSKLHRSGFDMSKLSGKFYQFDSIDFTLEPHDELGPQEIKRENLRIIFYAGKMDVQKIFELVSRLIRSRVIRIQNSL